MKFNRYIIGMAMAALALISCIREDLSECYGVNKLQLSYMGDGNTEIFQQKISSVEMYIFDAAVECVYNRALTDEELSQQEVTLPSLSVGEYRIVCVANGENTEVVATDGKDYSTMYFADKDYTAGSVTKSNDSLYWTSKSITVTSDDNTEVAQFVSSHYDIYVEVVGVDAQSGIQVEMSGLMPCTALDTNVAFGTATTYCPTVESIAAENLTKSTFNVMRHTDHTAVDVKVLDKSGAELAKVNLAQFLAANPTIDCSKQEVIIPISFSFKLADCTVSLPEWYIKDIKPEF